MAVDEQRAMGAALHSPLVHFVVEGEFVAEVACGSGEMGALLVGVGAVDDGEGGGEAERGQGFEGGDGVGADAFVRGVEDQAERQLRERAGSRAGAGGDGEGGAVAVGGWAVAGRVVPACGDLGGGDEFAGGAAGVGRAGEDRGGGGVDADVAAEVAEVAPAFGPAHWGERERGDDVLQQFPLALVCWVVILPGGGQRVGLMLGQAGAPIVAGWIQQGGQPVEGPVEAPGGGEHLVDVFGVDVGQAEPVACGGGQTERGDPPGLDEPAFALVRASPILPARSLPVAGQAKSRLDAPPPDIPSGLLSGVREPLSVRTWRVLTQPRVPPRA
ncbi:hypothetical protein AB0M50_34690 [Nonomuraea fuscirosea]|uniref:hypothetical protein n=1 Tax=Nonomuraea fuscirosea TaxID=1291556 RepID=UPI00343978B2